MCAYGSYENNGVVGMAKGTASREVICGGACRRGDADAIGLDRGKMLVITEQFNRRHCGVRPSIDYHFVQNVVCSIRVMCMVVVAFLANELLDQIATFAVALLRSHHCSFKA